MPPSFPPAYALDDSTIEFKLFVEELEHAAELLQTGSVARERMALLILDSLADRLLYQHAHRYLVGTEAMSWRRDRQYRRRERERILGDFGSKVNLALQEKDFPYPDALLDDLDAAIFRVAHRYRNAGYHRGQHNNVLTGPLGRLYSQAVGRAFGRSASGWVTSKIDDVAIRELDRFEWRKPEEEAGWFSPRPAAERIGARITGPLIVEPGVLAEQLVADFEDRGTELEQSVSELRRDGLSDEEIGSLLEGAQHWAEHRGDEQLIELKEQKQRLVAQVHPEGEVTDDLRDAYRKNERAQIRRMEDLKETTKVQFDLATVEELRRHATRIRDVSGIAPLLQRYEHLDKQLTLLEAAMLWVTIEWDQWVQHQVDVARGK